MAVRPREGKGREGKGREGKGREGKGRGVTSVSRPFISMTFLFLNSADRLVSACH